MTQEQKQLLFKDLCGRLPYDTIISVNNGKYREDVKLHPHYIFDWDAERWDAKPYLRPMSSMTEEEKVGYNLAADRDLDRMAEKVGRKLQGNENLDETLTPYYEHIDWLNSHHFDYRGLIPLGLGIDCTGLNIYENEKSI